MTDLPPRSPELTSLLTRARGDGPTPARLASVRARLESELGPLGVAPPAPPATEPAPSPADPSTSGPVAGGPGGPSLGLLSLPTLALALFLVGRILLAAPVPTAAPSMPAAHDPPAVPPSAPVATTAAPEVPTAAPDVPTHVTTPPSEPVLAAPPSVPATSVPAASAPVRTRPVPRADEPAPASDEATSGSTLREELTLLERAMARRRAGDLEGARQAIAEHARRFPQGIMSPERERLAAELDASP